MTISFIHKKPRKDDKRELSYKLGTMPKIDLKEKPWIKILLHSESILNSSEVAAFLDLNHTEYVDIDVTPTTNLELIDVFAQNDIDVPHYKIEDGNIAMYYKNGFRNAQTYYDNYKYLLENLGSAVTNEDLLMCRRYDFFIVHDSDPLHNDTSIRNLSTLEDVKKYIRFIFSNNNVFLYRHNQILGEGWYYFYRFKTVFTCYQEPWAIFVHLRDKYPQVYRSMGSLSTRLNFIIRAYEKVGYFSFDLDYDDSHSNLLYHLGFFVMLCTGCFDDLAWIAKYLYNLTLEKRQVSIRGKKYLNSIRDHNSSLYNLLSNSGFREGLDSFYPIRDSLQHRNYLSSYTLQSGTNTDQMIYLDEESVQHLTKFVDKTCIRHHMSDSQRTQYSIHPRLLIDHLMTSFIKIFTRFYQAIDWSTLKSELPESDRVEVENSMREFHEDIGHYIGAGSDAMYF